MMTSRHGNPFWPLHTESTQPVNSTHNGLLMRSFYGVFVVTWFSVWTSGWWNHMPKRSCDIIARYPEQWWPKTKLFPVSISRYAHLRVWILWMKWSIYKITYRTNTCNFILLYNLFGNDLVPEWGNIIATINDDDDPLYNEPQRVR